MEDLEQKLCDLTYISDKLIEIDEVASSFDIDLGLQDAIDEIKEAIEVTEKELDEYLAREAAAQEAAYRRSVL